MDGGTAGEERSIACCVGALVEVELVWECVHIESISLSCPGLL